jgi:hypothetical protein
VVREADLHLDLLAARDPAMEAPAVVDHPPHQAVVLLGNRPGELAADDVVREVPGESQVGKAVEQAEGEEQVRGHPVAVRLEVQRHAGVLGHPAPALDVGHAFGHRVRPHVGLQVQMVGAELGHVGQHRAQVLDGLRIALGLPGQAPGVELPRDGPDVVAIEEANARTVEAGGMDHVELLVERPLQAVRAAPLHRPQRLQDEKALHLSRPCRRTAARRGRTQASR